MDYPSSPAEYARAFGLGGDPLPGTAGSRLMAHLAGLASRAASRPPRLR